MTTEEKKIISLIDQVKDKTKVSRELAEIFPHVRALSIYRNWFYGIKSVPIDKQEKVLKHLEDYIERQNQDESNTVTNN